MNVRAYLLDHQSEDALKAWLVQGFRSGDWTPVSFDLRTSIPVQIQAAFEELPAVAQDRLRSAVVRAAAEWSPLYPELLHSLSVLGAYIKATRMAPILRTLITTKLSERCDEPVFADVTATAIAALVGFSPLPEAADAIETLYFNEHLPARYAGQLLNGMVRADAKNVYRYLPRFVRTAFNYPGLFRMDIILGRLVDEVSPTVLCENRRRMDADTNDLFTLLLAEAGIAFNERGEITAEFDDAKAVRQLVVADVERVRHMDLVELFGETR